MRRLCNSAFMGGLRVAQGLGCATRETAAVMIVEHLPLTERVGIVKDLDAGVAAAVAAEAGAPPSLPSPARSGATFSAADQRLLAGLVDAVEDLLGLGVGNAIGVVFSDPFHC